MQLVKILITFHCKPYGCFSPSNPRPKIQPGLGNFTVRAADLNSPAKYSPQRTRHRETWGSISDVCLTSVPLATAASKASPGCPPACQETWGLHLLASSRPYSRTVLFILFFLLISGFSGFGGGGYFFVCFCCCCFAFTQTFWVSNQLSEFPTGRLITSYWLVWRTFLPLGMAHSCLCGFSVYTHSAT